MNPQPTTEAAWNDLLDRFRPTLEAANEDCIRRLTALWREIDYLRHNLATCDAYGCGESSVGAAYRRRRNSRYGALHQQRRSEWEQRLRAAEQAAERINSCDI